MCPFNVDELRGSEIQASAHVSCRISTDDTLFNVSDMQLLGSNAPKEYNSLKELVQADKDKNGYDTWVQVGSFTLCVMIIKSLCTSSCFISKH